MSKLKESIRKAKIESKSDFIKFRKSIIPKFKSKKIKQEYSAESNSIFVGEYGYPNVNVGVLSAEEYQHNDDSQHWVKNDWKISRIAESRFGLINSKRITEVKATEDLSSQQEIALAKKPTSVDVRLTEKPRSDFAFDKMHKPMGPSVNLRDLKLTSNPRIPTKVDKVVNDTDLLSADGLGILYKKGFNYDYLTQAITSGSLGLKDNRKIVPTKWGITAVDDIVGKQLISKIKDYQMTGNLAFSGEYLGNYFLVLVFEGGFEYELFEFFRDTEGWTTDYEGFLGRKGYAKETAGGYYAARISVLEKFNEMKRQGQALLLRFITDEYYMPLGVWVVRQAVKNTMNSKPIEFGSPELMIQYAKKVASRKFGRDLSWLENKSLLLKERKQKKIWDY